MLSKLYKRPILGFPLRVADFIAAVTLLVVTVGLIATGGAALFAFVLVMLLIGGVVALLRKV